MNYLLSLFTNNENLTLFLPAKAATNHNVNIILLLLF